MADIRAVAAAFGLDQLDGEPESLAGGEQGHAWMIATRDGRWVVKQLSSERAPDRVEDARAFAGVAGSDVAMPTTRARADGTSLLDGSVVGSPGTWFRVMEWLDLEQDGDVGPEELGEVAAAIHRIDCPPVRDVEPWFARGLDDQDWEALLAGAWRVEAVWVGELQRRVPALSRLHALAEARAGRPLVSHRDLNLSNLVRTRSGQLVVLDWDLCGPVDPRRELALALVQLEVSDPGAATIAYRSYVEADGPARLDAVDAFASVSIALDNLIQLYATQLLEGGADSARAGQRLAWLFDAVDLVTVGWLERLTGRLSAVAD